MMREPEPVPAVQEKRVAAFHLRAFEIADVDDQGEPLVIHLGNHRHELQLFGGGVRHVAEGGECELRGVCARADRERQQQRA